MKLCRYPFTVTALLIMLSIGAVLQAQTTGQITGSVVDASGAVIPAAQVTAIAVDTGQKRTTATDAKGSYVFLALQTGHYRLAISKPGFQTFEQTGVTIDVNSALVINAKLQIGTVNPYSCDHSAAEKLCWFPNGFWLRFTGRVTYRETPVMNG